MKYIIILVVAFVTLICFFIYGLSSLGGGTLGASGNVELKCPTYDVEKKLKALLLTELFKIQDADSGVVNSWETGGYGFLNYTCIEMKDTLFMISLHEEGNVGCELSIRSYYNRTIGRWVYAKDFTKSEHIDAHIAMDFLSMYFNDCK